MRWYLEGERFALHHKNVFPIRLLGMRINGTFSVFLFGASACVGDVFAFPQIAVCFKVHFHVVARPCSLIELMHSIQEVFGEFCESCFSVLFLYRSVTLPLPPLLPHPVAMELAFCHSAHTPKQHSILYVVCRRFFFFFFVVDRTCAVTICATCRVC
jgi:hypothetical protein